jgi:hypothetical protein
MFLRLNDLIEASERLSALLANVSLEEFEADWQKQWLVERGYRAAQCPSRAGSAFLRHPSGEKPSVGTVVTQLSSF